MQQVARMSRNKKGAKGSLFIFLQCRLEVFLDHFTERLFSRHAGTHHGGDFRRMFADGIGQRGAIVLEVLVFFGIDQFLGARCSTRCAWSAGTRDTAGAAAGGLEAAGLGQFDLFQREGTGCIAGREFTFFGMMQMMIAVERHFLAGTVGQLIVRTIAGCHQRELHAFTVNVHLGDDTGEKGGLE